MRNRPHDWSPWRAAERPVASFGRHARHRLALAYANSYHVGMSSLALQRVYELVHRREGWAAERFFLDGEGMPLSVETETPLAEFGCVAFSVSFEEDYVNLAAHARPRAASRCAASDARRLAIRWWCSAAPARRSIRCRWREFVDVFPLGAAENLLPLLLPALEEERDREAVLERLAATPGFYVPARHRPGGARRRRPSCASSSSPPSR